MLVAIIADDLTGANDTGVQFCQYGFRTVVIIEPDAAVSRLSRAGNGEDVWAVNTDTRRLAPSEAYRCVYDLVKRIKGADIEHVYKKIDSTLRGHPGAELEAVMDAWHSPLALVVPAYPANGRVIRGGYLIVGQDSGVTADGTPGPEAGKNTRHIPTVLRQEMNRSIGVVDIVTVRQGVAALTHRLKSAGKEKQVLIIDAVDDRDLEIIARAVGYLPKEVVIAGAAGLAGHLASNWRTPVVHRPHPGEEGVILFVIGTYNPVTTKQVQRLLEVTGSRPIQLDTGAVLNGNGGMEVQRIVDELAGEQKGTGLVIISVSSLFRGTPEDCGNRDASEVIASTLGAVAGRLITGMKVKGLMVTGGNTALHVCHTLGVQAIDLSAQILPGVPLGYIEGDQAGGLPIVTKAGGFGSQDALIDVFQYLNEL